MKFTNSEKAEHGRNAKKSISFLLEDCKNKGYLKNVEYEYKIGMPGYSNESQFYSQFLITFDDEEKWAIYSTTSMRTDRLKGHQWDAINLRNINKKIVKIFIIYPDGLSKTDIDAFKRQNDKYVNKVEYSEIDLILSQDQLYNLIEEKATKSLNSGKRKDLQGRNFEKQISLCLSDESNLRKWKTNDKTINGLYYPKFITILHKIGIDKNEIESINASTEIEPLPNGGKPKTDVDVKINLINKLTTVEFTISCKRSSAKTVTVHEYSAEAFATTLDPENKRLKDLLLKFQQNPSLSSFGEENGNELQKELVPYNEKLTKWVLSGIGGQGNQKQCATHILIYDNNSHDISFYSINEYIQHLKDEKVRGHFGTFFSWTYPSKKRGKKIQLKCKIIK